jgi:hypothetical protein
VAVRWRLGIPPGDAERVALLVRDLPSHRDLTEAVARLPEACLLELARRAGVQPDSDPPEVIARPFPAELLWPPDGADRRDPGLNASRTQPGAAVG